MIRSEKIFDWRKFVVSDENERVERWRFHNSFDKPKPSDFYFPPFYKARKLSRSCLVLTETLESEKGKRNMNWGKIYWMQM